MTVALIDDDAAVLHSMRLLIESRDITVSCYELAEEFLEGLSDAKPSCVIADVRMPGMTGLELQRELKYRNLEAPDSDQRPCRCVDGRAGAQERRV